MKIIAVVLLVFFTSIGLTTGGTIGGLVPAPKFIKGKISKGIYTSPKEDFQIEVPNWNNKSEYQYMKIKEKFSKTGEYLSFGPAATNRNIYRVEYVKKLNSISYYIELKKNKDSIFKSYISQIEKAYHSKVELISEGIDLFNAKKSYSRIYRQYTPKKKKLFKTIAEDLRYHFIDIVDYGLYNILFWVEIPINPKNSKEIEEKLKNRENSDYQSFIKSFHYQKKAKNHLKGLLENNYYVFPNQEFSIKIPYSITDMNFAKNEVNYANIEEGNSKEIDFVIFGPSITDYNMYHVVLLHFPFEQDKDKYIRFLLANKLEGRSVGMEQKYFEKFNYKGLDRYYAVFESENDFLVVCITDNDKNFYEIEIDISKNTNNSKVSLDLLKKREYKVFNEMLDSFELRKK